MDDFVARPSGSSRGRLSMRTWELIKAVFNDVTVSGIFDLNIVSVVSYPDASKRATDVKPSEVLARLSYLITKKIRFLSNRQL
jgi:hypothetical protein